MSSDPVFHRYFSESFIKNGISLFKTEYDRVTAGHAVDRTGVTALEVFAFGLRFNFSIDAVVFRRYFVKRSP